MKKFNISAVILTAIISFGLVGPISVSAATATAPSLGDAASFSVLGAAAMSSANITTISGDLGLSPGLAASKTGTWTHTGGADYFGTGGLSASAQIAALAAFNNLASQTTSGVWASNSPAPGVWTIASDQTFSGTLTLDGDYSDVWVFQIGRDFTFSGSIVLAGNAQACNVFFQVVRDATIASDSTFVGTLIAQNNITSASGATINGRLISLTGTFIAMNGANSTISGPTCVAAPIAGSLPTQGTINVVKTVVNDNGRTKTVADFPLFVNGTSVISGETNSFTAPAAAFTVTETADPNYTRVFSGDCDANGQFNLIGGDNKFCIVTNNDIGAPVIVPPVPPLIDIVKTANPLSLPAGPGSVTYTYTLRNIGVVPVSNITMVGDSCGPINLISGDLNNDAKLDLAETWVYTCSRTLSVTHTNTVVATGWANGISATDIASASVVVGQPIIPPLIHIVKVPSPLTLRAGGGTVTYTYTITNPGTEPLSNVTVADDKCTGLPGRVIGHPGDLNNNNLLENNEIWTFTCVSKLTQTTVNTATAIGEANGLTAKDYAIATVVVAAAAVPKLPNTGASSVIGDMAWSIVAIAGIIVVSLVSLWVALKRRAF
ncbi:MAG: ice-binding family protein [Patescibacteria group bacterium]|jgi:hypothetical protein